MFKLLFISSALALSAATYLNRDGGVAVCPEHYTGHNCDIYKPNRHCADLKQFHGIDKSGYYNIAWTEKGYNFEVYCDMETAGGGWTLMSSAEGAEFAFVTYAQYQKPFGGKGKSVNWLGLDNMSAMTQAVETSLRIDLHGCGLKENKKQFPLNTMDIYNSFRVNSADKGYSIFIPDEHSAGNNTLPEGFLNWNPSEEGPEFSTFDNDKQMCWRNGQYWILVPPLEGDMPSHESEWGWIFHRLCKVRKVCTKDNRYDQTLLTYHNNHIKQASMWLRPRHFLEDSKYTDQTGDHYASNA